MNTVLTVSVQENLLELLKVFGELKVVVPAALRQYLMDRCLQRIEQAERQIALYENRYGMDYKTFQQRVATDQSYLEYLNRVNPLWEADAVEWVYRLEEAEAWRERLQKALQTSLPSPAPG
ncbi:MAG: hypothetical protein ACUVV0_11690 [Anaerolineae bacterium]